MYFTGFGINSSKHLKRCFTFKKISQLARFKSFCEIAIILYPNIVPRNHYKLTYNPLTNFFEQLFENFHRSGLKEPHSVPRDKGCGTAKADTLVYLMHVSRALLFANFECPKTNGNAPQRPTTSVNFKLQFAGNAVLFVSRFRQGNWISVRACLH